VTFVPSKGILFFSKSFLIKCIVFCLVITTGFYSYERSRWITTDTTNKEARQYLVTGMVLADFRTFTLRFIYPERSIWKPAVWLQQLISASGRRLVPVNDAEHAIWVYHFELAPFINRIHAPHNEAVYPLIDACEFVLETLATKEMADTELRTKNKYIIYPLVALYYQYSYKGKYYVKPSPWRYEKGLYKDPAQYTYLQQVVEWMIAMEEEWAVQPLVMEYMRTNPDIHLIQYVATALLLHEILHYQIHNHELTCEDRYFDLYYQYIEKYHGKDSPYHRVEQRMQRQFDHPVILHGDLINFFGHRLCGRPKLQAYNIRKAGKLKSYGPGWYEAFVALNRKLVPAEEQEANLIKRDPWK
jgi:hypothetical protein